MNNFKVAVIVLNLSLIVYSFQYYCPSDVVQLITSSEVSSSNVLYGDNFQDVLNVSHVYATYFWDVLERTLPNQGDLTFIDTYIAMGFTAAGDYSNNGRFEYYVSNFSLQYSASLNDSFVSYPQYFTANNPDERIFYFDNPIVFQRLKITIHEAEPGYGLRLVLIGCPLTSAKTVIIYSSPSPLSPVPPPSPVSPLLPLPVSPSSPSSPPSPVSPPSPIVVTKLVYLTPSTIQSPDDQMIIWAVLAAVGATAVVLAVLLICTVLMIVILFTYRHKRRKEAHVSDRNDNSITDHIGDCTGEYDSIIITDNPLYDQENNNNSTETNTDAIYEAMNEGSTIENYHTVQENNRKTSMYSQADSAFEESSSGTLTSQQYYSFDTSKNLVVINNIAYARYSTSD